jgi:SH3-like domain-containing protein
MRAIVFGWLLALIATACATATAIPSPSAEATPATFTAAAAPTGLPPTALTPPTTTVPAPFVPFTVTTWTDNVLLRNGPGYLFAHSAVLSKGVRLQVLGRSPGAEWVLAQTTDNRVGWVFAKLLENQGSAWPAAPFVQPPSVQLLKGSLQDESGAPISGVQFTFTQGAGTRAPRNDAMTDETSTFFAFMPLEASGTWLVSYTAVACTSNTMDANCNCKNGVCGKPQPEAMNISLPMPADQVLRFVWK